MRQGRLGTKMELIEDLMHELRHAHKHHPENFEKVLEAVRAAMYCSANAKKLRDWMMHDFGDFMSDVEVCNHDH